MTSEQAPQPLGVSEGALSVGPCRTGHRVTACCLRHLPYEPRTELRCPVSGSVPLARSLTPPFSSPLGLVNRRQVLRKLRASLCQSSSSHVGPKGEIRNFYPELDGLIHRFIDHNRRNQPENSIFPTGVPSPPRRNSLTRTATESSTAKFEPMRLPWRPARVPLDKRSSEGRYLSAHE